MNGMANFCFHELVDKFRAVSKIEDCKRIKNVLLDHGYDLRLNECEDFWENLSAYFSARWLNLPEDDESLWVLLSTGSYPD